MKILNNCLNKLDAIKDKVKIDNGNYDYNLILDLLNQLEQDIKQCIKIDEKILDFFKNKKNFKTLDELKNFAKNKIRITPKKKTRNDIEEELTKISTSQNLNLEKLILLLDKPFIQSQKSVKKAPSKGSTKSQKTKIPDQTSRWLGLTSNQLKDELNDLNKYPDSVSLKQAAVSLLKSNEKKLGKREKIIDIVIKRISEDRAISHLGR